MPRTHHATAKVDGIFLVSRRGIEPRSRAPKARAQPIGQQLIDWCIVLESNQAGAFARRVYSPAGSPSPSNYTKWSAKSDSN